MYIVQADRAAVKQTTRIAEQAVSRGQADHGWQLARQCVFSQFSRVGLKSDGTTGQTMGHLAARGYASRYMARRKATRQATELTTV